MNELYEQHPWKSINKFMPFALNKGFTKSEVKKFFRENVIKDKTAFDVKQYFLPVYGRSEGCYQFDTLIQSRGSNPPAFLIFINVNSRKAFAYPMKNKGKDEVLRVLQMFVNDVKVNELVSDQDSAYLSEDVIDFINSKDINYKTTEDNNHNVLGIIDRFIRTLRDLNRNERNFTVSSMNKVIDTYNNTTHSSTGIAPNKFSSKDENEYIENKNKITEAVLSRPDFMFNKGDKVRIILDKKTLGKRRSNLSPECYVVDSLNGYSFVIKAKDDSVATYPRYKLIKCSDNVPLASSISEGKRGIINEIISYNPKTDKYKIFYEGGVNDEIKAKNLRETNPTRLSQMEIEFWKGKNNIPPQIMKYKGLK